MNCWDAIAGLLLSDDMRMELIRGMHLRLWDLVRFFMESARRCSCSTGEREACCGENVPLLLLETTEERLLGEALDDVGAEGSFDLLMELCRRLRPDTSGLLVGEEETTLSFFSDLVE